MEKSTTKLIMSIDKGEHSNIFDLRSFRGLDSETDHYLVVAKVRNRLSVSKGEAKTFHTDRFNIKNLNDVGVKESVILTFHGKLG
jgi:hypothetical protein